MPGPSPRSVSPAPHARAAVAGTRTSRQHGSCDQTLGLRETGGAFERVWNATSCSIQDQGWPERGGGGSGPQGWTWTEEDVTQPPHPRAGALPACGRAGTETHRQKPVHRVTCGPCSLTPFPPQLTRGRHPPKKEEEATPARVCQSAVSFPGATAKQAGLPQSGVIHKLEDHAEREHLGFLNFSHVMSHSRTVV